MPVHLLTRTLIPSDQGPTLMPLIYLNYLHNGPVSVTLGLRLQYMNFGGHNSVHCTSLFRFKAVALLLLADDQSHFDSS